MDTGRIIKCSSMNFQPAKPSKKLRHSLSSNNIAAYSMEPTIKEDNQSQSHIPSNENILSGTSEYLKSAREALSLEFSKRNDTHLDLIFYYFMEIKLFPNIPHNIKLNLCKAAKLELFPSNTIIANLGDTFQCSYLVISGDVDFKKDNENIKYSLGQKFGLSFTGKMFKKSKSTGIYMVSDSPCELITISLSEFNKGQKEENVPDEDIDMVEALFDNNLLIAATAEKLIDTLFDEKYLEHEPNFIVDFFISYKIYMDDTKALMNKIELCLNTDVLRQQAVSALITWITYCPDDFQDNYMQDFVIFILNLLQSKSCIALADVVSQVCYNKSMAYEVQFSLDQDEDIPIRFKYRIVPGCGRNHIELFIVHFDPHSKAAGANIQLYDEVLFLNDYAISDINVATLKKILSESTLYLFILKRCVTKYQYVKNALIDLYEAKFRPQSVFSVSSQLERKKTQKSGSIFDTINPRKISVLRVLTLRKNRKKPLTPNVMTDFQTVDSSHSSLGDLINPISEKNVKYPVIQANNDFSHDEINNQENSNVSDSSSNAHFVLKILNASNDPKYSVFSRCDNCKKIAHELFLHSLSYKRATSLLLSDKWATISSSSSPHIFLAKTSPAGFKMSRLNDDFFDLPTKYSPGIRFYTATSSAAIKISSEVEAEMKNEELISLLTLDCCILAKILTIYDFYQFSKIVPKEYLSRVFKKKVNATCYNLEYFEERCNFEVMWVVVEILNEPKLKNRAKLICKFIQIAKYCLELGNFNSFFSLVSGLEHNLILRLKTTWELVTPKSLKLFGYLKSLCSPLNNMSLYRGWLIKYSVSKNRDNNSIIIPLIPLIVKDLTFINDSSKTMFSQNQINYRKIRFIGKELRKISYFRDINFVKRFI